MLIIEFNKVRPLDVLLTSGGTKFSAAIKTAVTIARAGDSAAFSHASLFLAPTLIVESLFKEGVVFSNLVEPDMNDPSATSNERGFRGRRFLIPRMDAGRLRLFAVLDGVNAATVYRHKASESINEATMNWMLRREVFEMLRDHYLAQYPSLGRLVLPLNAPERIAQRLERMSNAMQKKVLPGPFCSELVTIAFIAVSDFIGAAINEHLEGKASSVAPSDYARYFDVVPEAVVNCQLADLPGDPCSDTLTMELETVLTSEGIRHQLFDSMLLQLTAVLPGAIRTSVEEGSKSWDEHYDKDRYGLRTEWLNRVEEFLRIGSDPLWRWVHASNVCRPTCPARRLERKDIINLAPGGSPPLDMSFPEWKRVKYWDGRPCADARDCVGMGSWDETWLGLNRTFSEGKESIRERLNARIEALEGRSP